MPESWGNNMFKCCSPTFSADFFNSLVDDLPILFMQKREDSCNFYFWEVSDVGEWNYADYFVSRGIPIPAGWDVGQVTKGTTKEEDVEEKVKDVVHLIMAKQHLLNDLDNNVEMQELVRIMGKINVLCRMIVSLLALYVAPVMYSVAMTWALC